MARIEFDFLSQAPDVDVDRSWRNKRSFLPYRVEELIPSQHAASMGGEVFKQAEFANCRQHVAPRDLHGHRRDVNLQIAQPENFRSSRRVSYPAKHRTNARDQFARAKRLRDVVIASEF